MNKIDQRHMRVLAYITVILLSLQPVSSVAFSVSPSSDPVQTKIAVLGVLAFQDETDSGAPPELGRRIAQQLKQRLSVSFNDIVPKSLSLSSDTPSPVSLEQAVAIGKQNGLQFVVRGGLLALTVDDQLSVNARLYAEIISVESGTVDVVNGQGSGTGTAATANGIQWSAVDLNGTGFTSTAPGSALASAIDSLAKSIHESIGAPAPAATEGSPPTTNPTVTSEPAEAVDTAAPEADQELQQLVSQAEEFVASGSGETEGLKPVSSALEKLKSALTSKASQIEAGADATAADAEIASARTELGTALTSATEAAAGAETGSAEGAAPTGEKKGLLGSIDKVATEALGILQKIQ